MDYPDQNGRPLAWNGNNATPSTYLQPSQSPAPYLPLPSPYPPTTAQRNQQQWNHNAQLQRPYAMNMNTGHAHNYPNIPSSAPAPQFQMQQPQIIPPAQVFHQSTPQPPQTFQYQRTAEPPPINRILSSPFYETSQRMAPLPSDTQSQDKAMLLVSLAEEYFEAAHAMAPAIISSMSPDDVESYEKLVATGLGCLDTALKRAKLVPRLEANIRLRYAGVLFEETENYMEAETMLSKGISLCERNHYYDLKYVMQFMLAQVMAKNNPKAAMKALDGYISEANAYEHFSWVYVFRFSRSSLAMQSGSLNDLHASVQQLQAVASLSSDQGDYPVHLVASLMECMAHITMATPNKMEHARAAIAAARRNQGHASCMIPQLTGLTHILDLVSSLEEGNAAILHQKLMAMQQVIDQCLQGSEWRTNDDSIFIPIRRTPKSSQVISRDTRMVLGIGEGGGDCMRMSFLGKRDAYAICYILCGVIPINKNTVDGKSTKYLLEGIHALEDTTPVKGGALLPDLVSKHRWRGHLSCYFRIYIGFCHANAGAWPELQKCLIDLNSTAQKFDVPITGSLDLFVKYLKGIYYQGIGALDKALRVFKDEAFRNSQRKGSLTPSAMQFERDLGILAALNQLSIYQESKRQDKAKNKVLLEQLKTRCENHANKHIETAWNVLAAAIVTEPPMAMHETKAHLKKALNGASSTKNTQFLCITLSLMFNHFFSNIVGEQAEKSARAASVQAQYNGNPLWRSVADGALARCLEVQGKHEEAQVTLRYAQNFARAVLPH